jgi:hypothetical protein
MDQDWSAEETKEPVEPGDPRFSSGLPPAWQLDDEAFLRLSGYVERRRAPIIQNQAPPAPAESAVAVDPATPRAAQAFDEIVAELSHTVDSVAAETAPSASSTRVSAPGLPGRPAPEDEPLAEWRGPETNSHDAQRRLRDANARLAEAEHLLRALESQPRDADWEQTPMPEARAARHSIRRFFGALSVLIFVLAAIAAGLYALWYYSYEIKAIFDLP